ncbi:PfkB family carbohydrate kinase [Arthrobacter sp. ok909]|uniref:PfkB family carbohydrate kinase n=1 Tax=Arthrobacter sp. ok909 TaxID=1761746 RepID=UPI001587DCD3|nr:PfkB family carbohydrate kinase [Arthrobacter sp. ok909]
MNVRPSEPSLILDVIVAGEALIDIAITTARTVEHPGGSPANVAYRLGRLDVGTGFLTAIGEDGPGELIGDHLKNAGCNCRLDRPP